MSTAPMHAGPDLERPTHDRWVPLTGIQYNPGQHTHPTQMLGLLERFEPGFVTMEELGDQDDLVGAINGAGYGVIRGTKHPGQASTAVFYARDQAQLQDPFRHPLTGPRTDLGRGTGPDDGKAKDLKGATFHHAASERRLRVSVLHCYAGQKWGQHPNDRALISRDQIIRPAAHHLAEGYRGVNLLGLDGNAEPGRPLYDPLRHAGWECNHDQGRELTTHVPGHWSPDQWWVLDPRHQGQRPRIRFVEHQVVQPKRADEDHRALVVHYEIRVRR